MTDFFKSLVKLIEKYQKVIIMTHKNMDLDGFSSSLCLYNIVKKMDKCCFIYLNKEQSNDTINKTFRKLSKKDYHFDTIYDLENVSENDLLIIVDVHKKELIENDLILDKVKDVVIIDHHIKNIDYIKKTKLSYINSNMSSVSEIMVGFSRFVNYEIDELLATIMLAAIEIDTNGFNFKTSENTYLTAGYLTKLGASTIVKQEILRESKQKYLERQLFIEQSYQITENIIACNIDKQVTIRDLAIVADSLLQFENIEASFCIGNIGDNMVGISARSIGNIDVEKVMHELGGGGHKTEAATKINGPVEECEQRLRRIICK